MSEDHSSEPTRPFTADDWRRPRALVRRFRAAADRQFAEGQAGEERAEAARAREGGGGEVK